MADLHLIGERLSWARGPAVSLPSLTTNELVLLQRRVPDDDRVNVRQARLLHRRAFVKWTRDEDALLRRLFQDGEAVTVISKVLERNLNGVDARLKKLGLVVIKPPKPPTASPALTPRKAAMPVAATPKMPAPARVQVVALQHCSYCATAFPASDSVCPNCGASTVVQSHYLGVGSKLRQGQYTVGKVIGEGGFGITYMGAHVRARQPVAIKELFLQGASRRGLTLVPPRGVTVQQFALERQKCLDEARRIAQFRHDSIVKIVDAFEENGTVYIVMEYLHGQSLEQRVQHGGPLTTLEAGRIAEQLLLALEQIHAQGLLHRDIKPDNIMLCQTGLMARAVLIDFGAAREFQAHRTVQHSLILTPGYAPLEQYGSSLKRSPSSDLYALAGTLYFALTGKAPPPATERVQGVTLRPLPGHVVRESLGLAEALTAALSIRVDERPQTAGDMLERIQWQPRASAQPKLPQAPGLLEQLRKILGI